MDSQLGLGRTHLGHEKRSKENGMSTKMVVALFQMIGRHVIGSHEKKRIEVTLEEVSFEGGKVAVSGEYIDQELCRFHFSNFRPESLFKLSSIIPGEDPILECILKCISSKTPVMVKDKDEAKPKRAVLTAIHCYPSKIPIIQYSENLGTTSVGMDKVSIYPLL